MGISRVVVVGHSFGGAVAVCAASATPNVRAVVTLSSQTLGAAQMAPLLAGRPLLVVHGGRDKVLPVASAREIYAAAREPKELKILAEAGHGLTVARGELLDLLLRWIPRQLGRSGWQKAGWHLLSPAPPPGTLLGRRCRAAPWSGVAFPPFLARF
jgi:pimeloyl-ACP methyl ester carboxylesterase